MEKNKEMVVLLFHPGRVGISRFLCPGPPSPPTIERMLGQAQRERDSWGPSGPPSALCRGVALPCLFPNSCHLSCVFCQGLGGCLFQLEAYGAQSSKSRQRGLLGSRCPAWPRTQGRACHEAVKVASLPHDLYHSILSCRQPPGTACPLGFRGREEWGDG